MTHRCVLSAYGQTGTSNVVVLNYICPFSPQLRRNTSTQCNVDTWPVMYLLISLFVWRTGQRKRHRPLLFTKFKSLISKDHVVRESGGRVRERNFPF